MAAPKALRADGGDDGNIRTMEISTHFVDLPRPSTENNNRVLCGSARRSNNRAADNDVNAAVDDVHVQAIECLIRTCNFIEES